MSATTQSSFRVTAESAEPLENRASATASRFIATRRRTLELSARLTPEDMMVQSCAEASPAKWHLAHTTWFFESFILREFLPGYRVFNEDFTWLFNSYYQSFSAIPEKRLRASFSRPGVDEVLRYREHVDHAIELLLERNPLPEAIQRIELGANHEEQHQELLLTDILHAFFSNPLRPAYCSDASWVYPAASTGGKKIEWLSFPGGLSEFGHNGHGFCFDNELTRHRVWLEPFALASRLTSCGEFADFIKDGGYERPELWLSAGWDAVKANGWRAPLYWSRNDEGWSVFTLRGEFPLDVVKDSPVSQVSYFEADAYARWAAMRLPTEFEWEHAAEGCRGNTGNPGETEKPDEPPMGNFLDTGNLLPVASGESSSLFGDCWQWTASAYLAYPGFKSLEGALGEYNGKFMSGQMVLRGGSCVTPAAHIRSTYRNFFAPETRWQFSGIRLAQ
jgi:ergothioneine biosynthesis protein EgtB